MNKIGNQTLVENKKYPVVVLKESDLPVFVLIIGSKRKFKTYCALTTNADGFFLKRCNGKEISALPLDKV